MIILGILAAILTFVIVSFIGVLHMWLVYGLWPSSNWWVIFVVIGFIIGTVGGLLRKR